MPIQISRPVTVYRLWDNDDPRESFAVLAASGWLCSLAATSSPVVWSVQLQHNTNRIQLAAQVDDVIVTDGISVDVQTLADFNAANPDNEIVRD